MRRRALRHLLEGDVDHDGVDARDADRQAEELVERLGDDAEEVGRGARREEADDLLPERDDGVVVVGRRRVAQEEEERVRREEVRPALASVWRLQELEEVLQEEAPEPQELLADARTRRVRLAREERADGHVDAGEGLGCGVAQARVEECRQELEGALDADLCELNGCGAVDGSGVYDVEGVGEAGDGEGCSASSRRCTAWRGRRSRARTRSAVP